MDQPDLHTGNPLRHRLPRHGRGWFGVVSTCAVILLVTVGFVACGSTADASCSEFEGMDSEEQQQVAEDLLKENDADTEGFGGTVAVAATRSALQAYCSQADGSEQVSDAPDRVIEGLFEGLGS